MHNNWTTKKVAAGNSYCLMTDWMFNSNSEELLVFMASSTTSYNVMRTVWNLLILLVSVLQGNVYLRCVYLISSYNAAWCKRGLTQTQTQTTQCTERKEYQHHTCQLSRIRHRSSAFPYSSPNLPDKIIFWAFLCFSLRFSPFFS